MGEREDWQDADDAFNAALDYADAEQRAWADPEPWPAAVPATREVSRLMATGEWYEEPWYALDEDPPEPSGHGRPQ